MSDALRAWAGPAPGAARHAAVERLYPYARSLDQDAARPVRHPVVLVGAGPVGLALALDLARRGTPALLLDDTEGPGVGSKAICFSQRSLDIARRLGLGDAPARGGVAWSRGRVFHGADEVYSFDLQPEPGHRNPAFVNLQQPRFERMLVEAAARARAAGAPIEIRGCNRVSAFEPGEDGVELTVETPDGPYDLRADWLVACDGARSPLREAMGLGFEGRAFDDCFLIADIRMAADALGRGPTERWFWFAPPFGAGARSALLHRQPDDIWRLDFQLGPEIDRRAELDPARVRARADGMLAALAGEVPDYDLVWTSIYRFQCRRMARFRHGRVLFAGDSAHQVSPFGARGANGGLQDAENLGWKLDLVARGAAREALLDSYDAERAQAADENIRASSRATDFMVPRNGAAETFRDAVLGLARAQPFARPLINSGRLSVPCAYAGLPWLGEDGLPGAPAATRPGAPCPDAPLDAGFLLDRLGDGFVLLTLGPVDVPAGPVAPLRVLAPEPLLAARYLGRAPAGAYLIRPDAHVAARWAEPGPEAVARALDRALGAEAAPCS
jgi:3-(3-hydroxy-phenyl)propionate hydroxylase